MSVLVYVENWDGKSPDDLFDIGDLGNEGVGNGPARGFIVGKGLMPEGPAEKYENRILPKFTDG